MHPTHRRRAAVALSSVLLLLPACAGDGDADVAVEDPMISPQTSEDLAMKPEFEVPTDEAPPTDLVVEPLVEGDGEEATPGDTVTVHYVGKAWSTGEQFDASWDRGQPFSFELGAGRVIEGWDRGVAGMRVGGRTRLVIPPDLAYGASGAGGAIGPNETLVFVVDLLDVS